MTAAQSSSAAVADVIQRNWFWLVLLGALLVSSGAAALLAPFLAVIAIEAWIGAAFLLAGIAQLTQAFRAVGWRGALWHVVNGGLYMLGGLVVTFNPLAGIVALTIVIVATLLLTGGARIAAGIAMRPEKGWLWVCAGGVVAVAAAGVLAGAYPAATVVVMGVTVGLAFLSEGAAMIALGVSARRARAGHG